MHLTIWSFIPIVAAPLAVSVLIYMLRRVLQPPVNGNTLPIPVQSTTDTGDSKQPTVDAMWSTITSRWSPWVTRVLPPFVACAVILLVAWPFAYLGWALMLLTKDPSATHAIPPWFDNLGYFLGFGIIGAMGLFLGLIIVALAVICLYSLGKCMIWPQACSCTADTHDDTQE